jgi:2-O-(6-phospho-alpha-D-mannosyl)-D-glycerate hydrolase
VALIDDVLDQLERDRTLAFHLDGQAILADDYLAVRPDARRRLTRLVGAGRLTIGPWYVLADELLAGDEPLVRNLIEGRRRCADLGGWLPVGYSPDAFGHPDALPAVLAGFGIATAVLWRGYGGVRGEDLFRWRGPDGSEVLVHHLPPAGYEYGAELPADRIEAAKRWEALRAMLVPRASVPVVLVLNGADHHALQPELRRAVTALRSVSGSDVRVGTLTDYFDAVRQALKRDRRSIPVVHGELRSTSSHAWVLQGVAATRTPLKQRLAEGAALLTRWAEPQAALAAAQGGRERRPLLADLWKRHLANLSHDVVAGCVADEVAADVAVRGREVIECARDLLVTALDDRLGQDAVRRRRDMASRRPALVLVNPSPRKRSGVVEATMTFFAADVVVGRPAPAPVPQPLPPFTLVDPRGRTLPHQVLRVTAAHERLDSPRAYPDQNRVWAVRVAVRQADVPAFGLLRCDVREGIAPVSVKGDAIAASRTALAGTWGRVAVTGTGFAFLPGARVRLVPELVSERDEGDTYTIEPVAGDRPVIARWGSPRLVWPGPLVGAVSCDVTLGGRVRGRTFVRMDAGSKLLRIVVDGENRAGNHRVRLRLPVRAGRAATADMLYGPRRRPVVRHGAVRGRHEAPAPAAPMHRYVMAGGWLVCARGLHEYELLPDGTLAITLLRAVGDLSRGNLRQRPGHAGWPVATPDAQCRGPFRAELAVAYLGNDDPVRAEELADEFLAPLAGMMYRTGIDVPASVPGPELSGRGLAFRALKPREDGTGVVVRCVNVTNRPRSGVLRWPSAVTRAFRARLDETLLDELPSGRDRRTMRFVARAREVVTLVVET